MTSFTLIRTSHVTCNYHINFLLNFLWRMNVFGSVWLTRSRKDFGRGPTERISITPTGGRANPTTTAATRITLKWASRSTTKDFGSIWQTPTEITSSITSVKWLDRSSSTFFSNRHPEKNRTFSKKKHVMWPVFY